MRWHVHGTDATTGHDLVLAVDEQDATQAVQSAIAKRILVSHVTRDAGEGLRRMLLPLACVAIVVLVPVCIAFYAQNIAIRAQLSQAVIEQSRLAQSIAQAEALVNQLRQSTNMGEGASVETTAKMRELANELATARSRMSLTEQQLSTVHQQIENLENTAAQVPGLQTQLATAHVSLKTSEMQMRRLTEESSLQQKKLQELGGQPDLSFARIHTLEQANQDLSQQLDLLKSQLLVAAARSTVVPPATNPDEETPPIVPATGTRWALRVGYHAALEFSSLHFDKQTFAMTPLPDGTFASTTADPANAATIRFVHDRAKERVYTATLSLSLASDAPPDKLAQNAALAALFIKTFAPTFKDPETSLSAVTAQLAATDSSLRVVLLGDDYKLTIWNSGGGQGQFNFKIESPRADVDE